MDAHPHRRASDFTPDDHDLLITLSANLTNFMLRIEEQFKEGARARSEDLAMTTREIAELKARLTPLETWKNRVDGGAIVGREALALAFGAGGSVVAVLGFVLKVTGHI